MITFFMVDTDFNFDTLPFVGGFEAECEGYKFDIWLCYTGLGRTKKVASGEFSNLSYITSSQFNEQLRQMRLPDTTNSEGKVDVRTFIMMLDCAYRKALDLRLMKLPPYRRIMELDAKEAEMWSLIDAMQILEEKEVKK